MSKAMNRCSTLRFLIKMDYSFAARNKLSAFNYIIFCSISDSGGIWVKTSVIIKLNKDPSWIRLTFYPPVLMYLDCRVSIFVLIKLWLKQFLPTTVFIPNFVFTKSTVREILYFLYKGTWKGWTEELNSHATINRIIIKVVHHHQARNLFHWWIYSIF